MEPGRNYDNDVPLRQARALVAKLEAGNVTRAEQVIGATIAGGGRIALILDLPSLVKADARHM
jgi:chemotaxis protein histidine kinase CheA